MKRTLSLAPFALLLALLPLTGTVAARLLLLFACGGVAAWHWWRVEGARAAIPCRSALLAWVAICALSLGFAVDRGYTALELKNEIGYSMLAFLAFFTMAARRDTAVALLRALAAAFALVGLWGMLGWFANGMTWNETGRYGGSGTFATYIVTAAPALVWLAWNDPQRPVRRAAGGLLGFAVLLAAISVQRAAWITLALQALILLFFLRRRAGGFNGRHMAMAAVTVGAIAIAGLAVIQHQRSGQHELSDLSSDVRVAYWPHAIAKIADHPLVGAGFGRQAVRKAYPELTPPELPDLWHAHNVVLNYGLELGVPGMLALLVLFGAFARLFWRAAAHRGPGEASGWAGVAGILLIAGVLTRNQFNDFFVRDMALLFWALTGIFAGLATTATQNAGDTAR